jgi:hypothetical protein
MPISLSRNEEIEILERIARSAASSVARIQALKRLEELRNAEDRVPADFAARYDDEVGAKRRKKTAPRSE